MTHKDTTPELPDELETHIEYNYGFSERKRTEDIAEETLATVNQLIRYLKAKEESDD